VETNHPMDAAAGPCCWISQQSRSHAAVFGWRFRQRPWTSWFAELGSAASGSFGFLAFVRNQGPAVARAVVGQPVSDRRRQWRRHRPLKCSSRKTRWHRRCPEQVEVLLFGTTPLAIAAVPWRWVSFVICFSACCSHLSPVMVEM